MAVSRTERLVLQGAVALAAMVPILAGAGGAFQGLSFFDLEGPTAADSHVRYLSGFLLGIGLVFLASLYRIERHAVRFQILGVIVVLGGLDRLMDAVNSGPPSAIVIFALVMELNVTPVICIWQARIARG